MFGQDYAPTNDKKIRTMANSIIVKTPLDGCAAIKALKPVSILYEKTP